MRDSTGDYSGAQFCQPSRPLQMARHLVMGGQCKLIMPLLLT